MKLKITFWAATLSLILVQWTPIFGQMVVGNDTLYGNEWIDYNRNYVKIKVVQDGLYRVDYNTLSNAGVFAGATVPQGNEFRLFRHGRQVPLYVSTAGTLANTDFVVFYGQQNRGELDKFLYEDSTHQLNPYYSLFSDTASYYLTWDASLPSLQMTDVPNDLTNLPPVEQYCWYERFLEYHNFLSLGETYAGGGNLAAKYDKTEGYARVTLANVQDHNLPFTNQYTTGPSAKFRTRFYTQEGAHLIKVDVNGTNYVADTFTNWAVKNYEFTAPISTSTASYNVQIRGEASSEDKFRVVSVSAVYPRRLFFSNASQDVFEVEPSTQKKYFEVKNFTTGGQAPIVYDLTNGVRITTQLDGTTIKFTLPPSTKQRKIVLTNVFSYLSPISVTPVQFENFNQKQGTYLILSHRKLFDDGNGNNYVQDYADYRATALGGGYNSVVVDVMEVYEQFGYGILGHEQAVRNFTHWAMKNWNAEMLFVLGKGSFHGKRRDADPLWSPYDLVPSFGYPSSDNLLVAKKGSDSPEIPVGRVAAHTPDMVRIYLNKIKEMELQQKTAPQTIEDRAWMKNVLHLGGGDLSIQSFIKGQLYSMEDTLANSRFGANIFSLFKQSTNAVQSATSDDVIRFISEGVSWVTFFGHSAPNTLDFDIGDPSLYQNQGKYPMIYAMGCNTNRLFEVSSTLSEIYVFVEDRGAIGFLGSTATTSLSNLAYYGQILYEKMGTELYGEPIGKIVKSTVDDFGVPGFWGSLVKNNMMLHGDPAIRIYPHEGPDFVINQSKSKIEPTYVNVMQDSFKLNLRVMNLGYAVEDSLNILIEHQFPNGDKVTLKQLRLPSPKFEQTYSIQLPLVETEILGINRLVVTLDWNGQIAESPVAAEFNNTEIIPFTVISNSAIPVFPYDYSIVTEAPIRLNASTSNVFSDVINYFFELDTTVLFNSPTKITAQIQSPGGMLEWQPQFTPTDATVYYWRVSMDSTLTNGNGFDWKMSSFIYLPQSFEGWNQSHFYQKTNYSEAAFNYDSLNRKLEFLDRQTDVKINNSCVSSSFLPDEIAVYRDGFKIATAYPCPTGIGTETMHIAVFDTTKMDFKFAPYPVNVNCWTPNVYYMISPTSTDADRKKIMDFLQDSIQSGEVVLLFTAKRANQSLFAHQWAMDSTLYGMNIFQLLEQQGASQIRDMATNETSYIFIYKKDEPNWSEAREIKAATVNDIIQTTIVLSGNRSEGSVTSLPIGPATNWGDLSWKITDFDPTQDSVSLDLIGVRTDGTDTLLTEGITQFDLSLDYVNSNQFPYLKLRYNAKDATAFTPPNLDFWRVLFNPLPELALRPEVRLNFHADTLEQGDPLRFEILVQNISQQPMDSVLVKYSVANNANQQTDIYRRLVPLSNNDTTTAAIEIDTRALQLNSVFTIEVNPNNDQREQFHFNNVAVREFFVRPDRTDPVLDVTFDGIRIMDGDLVSAKPTIVATIEDENQFLPLEDTSAFKIFVRYPQGTLRRFYMDGQAVVFYPAEDLNDRNNAKIEFLPTFEEDGMYQLIVEAADASGNRAGKSQYKVNFEVINKPMISNVLNYPNPFSTSTQFVFTLTGSELPEALQIQIMTVSGKIVKTISKDELGNLKIGNNRTEYRWDGTDEFGQPLANGVYLYRVSLKSADGQAYENFNNGTNDYFKNGFGKMVILR